MFQERFQQVEGGLEPRPPPRSGRAEVWVVDPHGPFSVGFVTQGARKALWGVGQCTGLCLHVGEVGA